MNAIAEVGTSPSDPRTVRRYTTVTVPLSEKITSRISPHHPVKKNTFQIRNYCFNLVLTYPPKFKNTLL